MFLSNSYLSITHTQIIIHITGKSDPYVAFRLVSSVGKEASNDVHTKVIHDTLNPIWKDEVHTLRVPVSSREHFKSMSLIARVMDKDIMNSQLIGTKCLSLEGLATKQSIFVNMEPLERYSQMFGRGRISFSVKLQGGLKMIALRSFRT